MILKKWIVGLYDMFYSMLIIYKKYVYIFVEKFFLGIKLCGKLKNILKCLIIRLRCLWVLFKIKYFLWFS